MSPVIWPHFDAEKKYKAAETREDNLSPNAGFMEEYPLWVEILTMFLADKLRAFELHIITSSRAQCVAQ